MSSITKIILLFLLVVGIFSHAHTLSHFGKHFKKMKEAYHSKDTSTAFSMAMKIYTSVEIFMK